MSGTVVLLSGGVDSTVALAMKLDAGFEVEALTVDYGQRHRREIESASKIAHHYRVEHRIVSVTPELFSGSALTSDAEVPDGVATEPDATYVPARNTVLLALAAARADSIGARNVIIGANADDAAAYPDCRASYITAFRDVLIEGTIGHVWVSAPLLYMHKPKIIERAKQLNVPLELTWSCYQGGDEPCGTCGACISRGDYVVSG